MNTQIIIRLNPESPDSLQWLSLDDDGLIESQGLSTLAKLSELAENWQGKLVKLLVPGKQCSSVLEKIPAKSTRQIRAALPFAVEDNFAEDIEELHFAIGEPSTKGDVPALVVNKQQMTRWMQAFDDAGITPKLVTADHQALPKPADAAVLLLSENTSLLRLKDGRSFTLDNSILSLMLQQFASNPSSANPSSANSSSENSSSEKKDENSEEITLEKLLVFSSTVDDKNDLVKELSESLAESWDVQFEQTSNHSDTNSELLYLAQNLLSSSPINLLQNKFKRRTPASKNWLMWKWPAVATGVIVVLFLSTWTLDYFSLQQRLSNLKQAHTTVYKQAFPSEKTVVRPVSQMRGKLKAQGSGTQNSIFFPLLNKLSAALTKVKTTEITNINYRAKKGVLKIDFLAPDFASIQSLQDELKAQQLIVTPGTSNASGDKYSGRLTIKEKN